MPDEYEERLIRTALKSLVVIETSLRQRLKSARGKLRYARAHQSPVAVAFHTGAVGIFEDTLNELATQTGPIP